MSVFLHEGDCLNILKTLPSDSIDAVVTDPPYGISFMDRKWDYDVPSVAIWQEALRVLKPGGHLLSFSGTRTYHRMVVAIEDAGFEIRDQIGWLYGSGFPKSHNLDGDWDGWGTALKPAWEPIVLARRPLIGTVAENVLMHGTGAMNIDWCRVPADENLGRPCGTHGWQQHTKGFTRGGELVTESHPAGRWPANIIHDGSDEVLEAFAAFGAKRSAGDYPSPSDSTTPRSLIRNGWTGQQGQLYSDGGTAARFFYCAKTSKVERNGSKHPTIKPVSLMRYLCKLVTPPRGTVLDPFAGTGSTGQAAIDEGFNAILIEQEPEYCTTIRLRLALWLTPISDPVVPTS